MPGESRRLHWSFPDPAAVAGDGDERLSAFRRTRDAIEARITPRTKAIIPVHLHGMPADMDEINAIQVRQRLNLVTATGIPGFIAKGN